MQRGTNPDAKHVNTDMSVSSRGRLISARRSSGVVVWSRTSPGGVARGWLRGKSKCPVCIEHQGVFRVSVNRNRVWEAAGAMPDLKYCGVRMCESNRQVYPLRAGIAQQFNHVGPVSSECTSGLTGEQAMGRYTTGKVPPRCPSSKAVYEYHCRLHQQLTVGRFCDRSWGAVTDDSRRDQAPDSIQQLPCLSGGT